MNSAVFHMGSKGTLRVAYPLSHPLFFKRSFAYGQVQSKSNSMGGVQRA
jgi:hypothetical protein